MGSKGACSKGSSSYIHKTYVRPRLLDMHTHPYKDLPYSSAASGGAFPASSASISFEC